MPESIFARAQTLSQRPGTRHLGGILNSCFTCLIQTQDPRWYAAMESAGVEIEMPRTKHAGGKKPCSRKRQFEFVVNLNLSDDAKCDQPLIVVLSKADLWQRLLPKYRICDLSYRRSITFRLLTWIMLKQFRRSCATCC